MPNNCVYTHLLSGIFERAAEVKAELQWNDCCFDIGRRLFQALG